MDNGKFEVCLRMLVILNSCLLSSMCNSRLRRPRRSLPKYRVSSCFYALNLHSICTLKNTNAQGPWIVVNKSIILLLLLNNCIKAIVSFISGAIYQ